MLETETDRAVASGRVGESATIRCSCGGWCDARSKAADCYGKVAPIDQKGDYEWVHACEAHEEGLREKFNGHLGEIRP